MKLNSVVVLLDIERKLAAGEKGKEQGDGGTDLVQVDGGAADFGSRIPGHAVRRREAARFKKDKNRIYSARVWGRKMRLGWG